MTEEIKNNSNMGYEGFDKVFRESINDQNTRECNKKLFDEFINVLFDEENK